MSEKTLSRRQMAILGALGRGMIPCGGPHFQLGARDVEAQWLARADRVIGRMPLLTRWAIKTGLIFFDYLWPLWAKKKLTPLRRLTDPELEKVLTAVEAAGPLAAATLILPKVIVFPAFYGLPEAAAAIDYQTAFPVSSEFVGLKP